MRTTITLDPDTAALIKRRMHERGVSFKQAVNDAIRSGLTDTGAGDRREAFRTRSVPMGLPTVNLDRALQLAGELDDEERVRKMRQGK
ncbi:MAG: CopG family transcriptional regulator [Pseudonocardiaceae bacterium]